MVGGGIEDGWTDGGLEEGRGGSWRARVRCCCPVACFAWLGWLATRHPQQAVSVARLPTQFKVSKSQESPKSAAAKILQMRANNNTEKRLSPERRD